MPRIRKDRKISARSEYFWKIGLYIRLSKEDEKKSEKEDDSESVINQEKILRDFTAAYFKPGTYEIVDVFPDDGRTGTDTARPEFSRLVSDIIRGEINCMIIKSLARGFRNLADQQKFLEEFIPLHGTRFINIGNPFIDTFANPHSVSGLEVPIRGMFNEQLAAVTSEEVRKTFNMKRERGEFIGSFAPYGYRKDPDNKNRLLIDEEAAETVRIIFRWFVHEGYSKRGIAERLNQMGEPNPEAYKKKNGLKYQNPNSGTNDGLWSAITVYRLLRNAMYIGVMVQGKYRVINYKIHKQINVPEEEWFIVPGTHEAIIDQETFEKAQLLNQRDTRTSPGKKTVSIMAGLVRCAGCRKAMHRKTARNIPYYHCRTYIDKKTCSKHTIRQDNLEAAVLLALQIQIGLAGILPDEIERIRDAPSLRQETKHLSYALLQAEKQLKLHRVASDSLYMDWKGGELTREEYHRLKVKFTGQLRQLEETVSHLKEEIQIMTGSDGDDPCLTELLQHKNIQTLNRGIVVELIDAVWVHENGEITIDFHFADQYRHMTVMEDRLGK